MPELVTDFSAPASGKPGEKVKMKPKLSPKVLSVILLVTFLVTSCSANAPTATAAPTQVPAQSIATEEPIQSTLPPTTPSNTPLATEPAELPNTVSQAHAPLGSYAMIIDQDITTHIGKNKRLAAAVWMDGRTEKIKDNFYYTAANGVEVVLIWSSKYNDFFGFLGEDNVIQGKLVNPPSNWDQPPSFNVCTKDNCNGKFIALGIGEGDDKVTKPIRWSELKQYLSKEVIVEAEKQMARARLSQVCYKPFADYSDIVWCMPASPTPTSTFTATFTPTTTFTPTATFTRTPSKTTTSTATPTTARTSN